MPHAGFEPTIARTECRQQPGALPSQVGLNVPKRVGWKCGLVETKGRGQRVNLGQRPLHADVIGDVAQTDSKINKHKSNI